MFFAINVYAELTSETLEPIVFDRSTNAITVYIVGGATTTAASYTVFADSIAFTTADGLYPGTTHFVFADTDKDTLEEFVNYCNDVSVTTPGAEGGIVAAIVNGCYDKGATTDLTAGTDATILGVANIATITMDAILGISYILPASGLAPEQRYHITGINTNVTFASGTVYLKIYDGDDHTDTNLLKYEIDVTATETPIRSIPNNGDLAGSENTAIRIDVIGSAAITAGHITIIGYKK